MTQPDIKIFQLIVKYSNGGITEDEYRILQAWQNENIENKQVFSEYLVFFKNARRVNFSAKVSPELAWEIIQEKLNKRKKNSISLILRYAAILVVPIALWLTYIVLNKQKINEPLAVETSAIEPGKPKAMLALGDGSIFNLEEVSDSTTIIAAGTKIQKRNSIIDYRDAEPETEMQNTIRIPRGGEYSLVLSDGTKVWLNSESELIFPMKFSGEKRLISLKGEAYFEVAKNNDCPFVVDVEGVSVEVLGTSFNIKAYDNVETTLVEGKVRLHTNGSKETVLNPGEQGIVTQGNSGVVVKKVETRLYTSWKDGMFMFKSMALEEIMEMFERWYDAKVTYSEESLKKRRFTGNLERYEEIFPHLEIISLTTNVDFKITNNEVFVIRKK